MSRPDRETSVDAKESLRAIDFFAEILTPEQIDAVGAKSRVTLFQPGTHLMTEGEFGSSMFAIVHGHVEVTIQPRKDRPIFVAELGPGDIVGEMSMLTGARRVATVKAKDTVTVVEIGKVAFEGMLAQKPELIDTLGALLERRQGELKEAAAAGQPRLSADDIISRIRTVFANVFSATGGGRSISEG